MLVVNVSGEIEDADARRLREYTQLSCRFTFSRTFAGLGCWEPHYFVTAIDFRKSARLYTKNPRPIALTIRKWGQTALRPPPR